MKKFIKITLIFLVLLIAFSNIVYADMGPKPSITTKIKNINTSNYLIDLLVFDEDGTGYTSDMEPCGLTEDQTKTLYDINYDGWISASTRWHKYLLNSDCKGNSKFENIFSYFGTPETYKILIINNDTGEIKVSDVVNRKEFNSYVTIDYNTMKVRQQSIPFNGINTLIVLLITILVEVFIALIMKMKNIKTIIITNFITNIILQLVLIFVPLGSYILKFVIMEILVILFEFLIYKKFMKDQPQNKILIYTLIANILTGSITFIFI